MKTTKKTKRRPTIGADPLDALLEPVKAASKASRRGLAPAGTTPRPAERKPLRPPSVRATFHLPAPLLDELRDAVVALSGPPLRLTLARLAQDALQEKLHALQKAHNRGKPFPTRSGELKGGRPIGT